jgi:hypothetical protein
MRRTRRCRTGEYMNVIRPRTREYESHVRVWSGLDVHERNDGGG